MSNVIDFSESKQRLAHIIEGLAVLAKEQNRLEYVAAKRRFLPRSDVATSLPRIDSLFAFERQMQCVGISYDPSIWEIKSPADYQLEATARRLWGKTFRTGQLLQVR